MASGVATHVNWWGPGHDNPPPAPLGYATARGGWCQSQRRLSLLNILDVDVSGDLAACACEGDGIPGPVLG